MAPKLTHVAQPKSGIGPFDLDLPDVKERSAEGALHFFPGALRKVTAAEAAALKGDGRLEVAELPAPPAEKSTPPDAMDLIEPTPAPEETLPVAVKPKAKK